MDNQHRQITGYRELDRIEIALMNRIKDAERQVAAVWATVATGVGSTDPSAVAARSLFRQGFMELNRVVARPIDPFESALDTELGGI